MKKTFTILIAGTALVLSNGAFAQSQETSTTEPTTNVEVKTISKTETVQRATPVNKTGKPIKSETILDRQKKADQRVSKREPKK